MTTHFIQVSKHTYNTDKTLKDLKIEFAGNGYGFSVILNEDQVQFLIAELNIQGISKFEKMRELKDKETNGTIINSQS